MTERVGMGDVCQRSTPMILLALLPLAHALTCEEVGNMLDVGVPDDIVVQVLRDVGSVPPGLPGCLRDRGASAAVVAAAAAEPVEAGPVEAREPAAPEPTPAPPALPFPRGISARDLRHPWALTRVLFQRAIVPPGVHDPLLYAWLGVEFLALDLPHSAGRDFAQSVALGALGPVLERSWGGMVEVAERTGDDATLRRMLQQVLPEDVPRPYRDQAWFLVGRDLMDAGELTEALAALQEVSERSPYARDADFVRAVIYAEQARLKSAVRLFRRVYEGDPADREGQLALVNIARIYYSLERYDQAIDLYAQVPGGSPVYGQAQLELAWSELLADRPDELEQTLGRARAAAETSWLPEVHIVAALHAARQGGDVEVAGALRPLLALRPAAMTLTGAMNASRGPDWEPRAFYAEWLGPGAHPEVPATLIAALKDDPRLSGILSHLSVLDAEERRIHLIPGRWQAQAGSGLLISDEDDRAILETAAGRALRHVMGDRYLQLVDLLDQAELILAGLP